MLMNYQKIMRFAMPFVLICSCTFILIKLFFLVAISGGNGWQQGDWLINSSAGLVRRALIGDFVLLFANLSGLNPLLVLSTLQVVLLVSLYYLLYRLKDFVSLPIMFVLVCSPAFFPIFWWADWLASLKKETVVFVSILLLVYSIHHRFLMAFGFSALLFAIAVFSHEGQTTFAPLVAYIGFFRTKDVFSDKARKIYIVTICFVSVLAAIYGFLFAEGPGSDAVCNTLMSYKLSPDICLGAIKWLDISMAEVFNGIAQRTTVPNLSLFLIMYVMFFVPIFYVTMTKDNALRIFLYFILTGIVFIPLYFVATDWGRWISYHFFSFAAIILLDGSNNRKCFESAAKMASVFLIGIIFPMTITPSMIYGYIKGGVIGAMVVHADRHISRYIGGQPDYSEIGAGDNGDTRKSRNKALLSIENFMR